MKITNEVVLFYHVAEEKETAIRAVLDKLGIKGRRVAQEDFGKPIGAMAGLRVQAVEEPGEALPGEMLVLNGLTSRRLNQLLAALRGDGTSVALKAAVTEQNKTWNAYRLYSQILEEHQMMTGGNQ